MKRNRKRMFAARLIGVLLFSLTSLLACVPWASASGLAMLPGSSSLANRAAPSLSAETGSLRQIDYLPQNAPTPQYDPAQSGAPTDTDSSSSAAMAPSVRVRYEETGTHKALSPSEEQSFAGASTLSIKPKSIPRYVATGASVDGTAADIPQNASGIGSLTSGGVVVSEADATNDVVFYYKADADQNGIPDDDQSKVTVSFVKRYDDGREETFATETVAGWKNSSFSRTYQQIEAWKKPEGAWTLQKDTSIKTAFPSKGSETVTVYYSEGAAQASTTTGTAAAAATVTQDTASDRPWYQTGYAFAGASILLIVLFVVLVRMRMRRYQDVPAATGDLSVPPATTEPIPVGLAPEAFKNTRPSGPQRAPESKSGVATVAQKNTGAHEVALPQKATENTGAHEVALPQRATQKAVEHKVVPQKTTEQEAPPPKALQLPAPAAAPAALQAGPASQQVAPPGEEAVPAKRPAPPLSEQYFAKAAGLVRHGQLAVAATLFSESAAQASSDAAKAKALFQEMTCHIKLGDTKSASSEASALKAYLGELDRSDRIKAVAIMTHLKA